jgi:molecular chaperone GrpE
MMTPHSALDEIIATEAMDSATLIAENGALRERLARALADAENARRRAERMAQDMKRFAIGEFSRELLVVVDNLRRTVMATQGRDLGEAAPLLEGVQVTERILSNLLDRFGIRKIDALGARFDPSFHEAVMEEGDPSQPPGTVIRVIEDGYTIHDRLLRPARVAVVKRRADVAEGELRP